MIHRPISTRRRILLASGSVRREDILRSVLGQQNLVIISSNAKENLPKPTRTAAAAPAPAATTTTTTTPKSSLTSSSSPSSQEEQQQRFVRAAAQYAIDTAWLKAKTVLGRLMDDDGERAGPGSVLIAADTVVVHEGRILEKPKSEREALDMISSLAGHKHHVVTGHVVVFRDQHPHAAGPCPASPAKASAGQSSSPLFTFTCAPLSALAKQDAVPPAARRINTKKQVGVDAGVGRAEEQAAVAVGATAGVQPYVHTFYRITEVEFAPLTKACVEQYVRRGEWKDKAGGYGIQGAAGQFVTQIKGEYFNVVGLSANGIAWHLGLF